MKSASVPTPFLVCVPFPLPAQVITVPFGEVLRITLFVLSIAYTFPLGPTTAQGEYTERFGIVVIILEKEPGWGRFDAELTYPRACRDAPVAPVLVA
jgi:hypothetical protein